MPCAWHIGNCLEYPRPDRAPGRRLRLPLWTWLHKEGDPTNVTAAPSNYNIYIYIYPKEKGSFDDPKLLFVTFVTLLSKSTFVVSRQQVDRLLSPRRPEGGGEASLKKYSHK